MSADDKSEELAPREGRLRWVLGWIVTPAALVAAIFLGGVHMGARYPDMWMSRVSLWLLRGEADRGPSSTVDESWPFTSKRQPPQAKPESWLTPR